MRRREEKERGGAGRLDDLVQWLGGVARQLDEVAVRQHAPLRATGGPGRVDERRDVLAPGQVTATLDLRILDRRAGADAIVEMSEVHAPHVADGRQGGSHSAQAARVAGGPDCDAEGDGGGRGEGEATSR